MNSFIKFISISFFILIVSNVRAESPESDYYEMNIPPEALERCAKNGDPDCMFDFGNCLYDGICKGIGIKNKDLIKRDAYIFGISDYDDNKLDLDQPVNDAIDMDNYLEKNGYNTTLFKNPDLGDFSVFKLKASQTRKQNPSYDRNDVLFYYSGHGINLRGKNYIIPRDFTPGGDNILSLQSLNEIIEVIERNYDGIKILIFDACRNEGTSEEYTKSSLPLYETKQGKLKFNVATSGLAPIKAGPNTYIIYASSPGEVSWALRGMRNSVFTEAFIKNLYSDSGQDIDEVMMKTRESVMNKSKPSGNLQVPWNESSLNESYYISSREINKSEKELGIYWISKAAALGNEPALTMMATFYCSGQTGIPRNPPKGKQILKNLLENSNDPLVLQMAGYSMDYCDVDLTNNQQFDESEFMFNSLADNICANDVCLDFIFKTLKDNDFIPELVVVKFITVIGALDQGNETKKYSFSLYTLLKDSPIILDTIYSQIKGGLYKPELDYIEKTYPENPFKEEYLLAMKIYQITYDGFKEAYKSGEDFRNN